MRRFSPFFTLEGIAVSIHASVKDATKRQKRAIAAQKVSIHASVKDATIDARTLIQ